MQTPRRVDLLAVGLMAGPLVAALALWSSLPAELAVHWSGGEPDTFVSKPLGTLGLFAFGVVVVAVTRLAPASTTRAPGSENVNVALVGFVFAWVEATVLLWNLGYRFDVGLAVIPVVVAALLVLTYARVGNPLSR